MSQQFVFFSLCLMLSVCLSCHPYEPEEPEDNGWKPPGTTNGFGSIGGSCFRHQDCAECPMDVSCICKNGRCKITAGCGTTNIAFFYTECSSCNYEDCEDDGMCLWSNGKCNKRQ